MPLNLASPGILVREVDLTTGAVRPTEAITGAMVAPFAKGPVEVQTLIDTENDLLNIFGEPYGVDNHYEHWLTASSYLSYGGNLRIVRADDASLKNSHVSVGGTSGGVTDGVKIKSLDHYNELGYDLNTLGTTFVSAQNPGSWSNGIRVAIIDSFADQVLSGITTLTQEDVFNIATGPVSGTIVGSASTIGISTLGIEIGQEVKTTTINVLPSGTTVTNIFVGYIQISNANIQTSTVNGIFNFGQTVTENTSDPILVGYGVTQSMVGKISAGAGSTSALNGYLKGIITEVGTDNIAVKVLSYVNSNGVETNVDYEENGTYEFETTSPITIINNSGVSVATTDVQTKFDWFEQQTVAITTSVSIGWDGITYRPGTTEWAADRGGRFDEFHLLVIDGTGAITGNAGSIIEKHIGLSKATKAVFSVGSPSYWRQYLTTNSKYIFGLSGPRGIVTTGFGEAYEKETDIDWDQDADGIPFGAIGSRTYILSGGKNYDGKSDITEPGALKVNVGDIASGYDSFENDEIQIDFLLMGSAAYPKEDAQSLANKLISIAELRKDAVAFISPYRGAAIADTSSQTGANIRDSETITDNIVSFYASVASTTYAVFDSGYKYMFDRFNNTFRYVPLNGDIAGLCARTDINQFPWYSPAGTARGAILNAVKLPYNPGRLQRDRLYQNRVNSIIFSPGAGVVLFGDKTGYAKASAFDRINVRRLFIYLERAIERSAKDVLFEFNDTLTRQNFINTVEPFLRDVKAKRGIFDFLVVCDERNNTPAVIDNNEFIADIYIKPTRSINFIGLTFIATKTGVNFEEIIGTF
jgi:hypothetical protein